MVARLFPKFPRDDADNDGDHRFYLTTNSVNFIKYIVHIATIIFAKFKLTTVSWNIVWNLFRPVQSQQVSTRKI
ncbi:hypothetical protein BpHYR1_026738 [Brachionus plicatilis]|uniref:Uncharacterized protein n=1 Tax=Brachionus plicatilis TaxID=10195 RepID=A0A3M7RFK1_BRAPC|nr:hypothetical protein BpHYR1_026738 [Brachionus plicatilis]